MWNGDYDQTIDAGKIAGVARKHRESMCDSRRGNHGVVRPGRGVAPTSSQRASHLSERCRSRRVEWDRLKIGLGLLQMRLADRPLLVAGATSGPTESSASVTAVIKGSVGSSSGSRKRGSRMTVEVSRTPRVRSGAFITCDCRGVRQYRSGT